MIMSMCLYGKPWFQYMYLIFRCIRMALVHDMGEAICGDITPYDNVSQEEKHSRECEAMDEIAAKLFICASPSTSTYRTL